MYDSINYIITASWLKINSIVTRKEQNVFIREFYAFRQ